MNDALVQQLSSWLAATDIDWLELRGPGVRVRLRREGTHVEALPADAAPAQAAARTEAVTVRAPSVGIFLHAHPLHEQPLAAPGLAVHAGQVLGLLRVGALLLPVTAPHRGVVTGHAAADGVAVGYGAPLVHLACAPSNRSG
jgi:acetyl-CoA carboxylase biotin carboxyl carrier protein